MTCRLRTGPLAVACPAKADEGGVRVSKFGLAALVPELPPFLFQVIDVIAGGDGAGVVVGFRIEKGKLVMNGAILGLK